MGDGDADSAGADQTPTGRLRACQEAVAAALESFRCRLIPDVATEALTGRDGPVVILRPVVRIEAAN